MVIKSICLFSDVINEVFKVDGQITFDGLEIMF